MITFNNIVERFKVFAENHFFVKSFSFGSPDDVDLSKFTNFPLMHLVYTGATYDAGTKTYNLEVYILDVPSDKTKKVDRQKEVVSDAEQCAEDIIADIKNGGNIFLFAQDYEVVNANTTPLEEETKNVLSGVLLDLSVAIPYEWDACNAPIDGVEPGGTEVTYARRGILRMLTLDGATDVPSVRTIKVTNGTLTDDGDGVVTLDTGGVDRLSQLEDTNIVTPSDREALIYDGGQWVNDTLGKGDVGLANVDNTSDADKPVSTATQTALDAKADTSAVPTELNDLSDVTISGTPTGNQALIYDAGSNVFRSADNFTNRFEDDVERGSGNITPFVERAYGVKSDGDGIFIDNQSDTPSAGKVIKRKIYHKAGLITDTDVIGDYTLIHTFDDDTAYSATESTFEGFRDGDTYGTPPFTLIQTWEEEDAAPSFTGLLNESYGSGAAAAYGTRRLNGLYTGACMTIRRASDGTTTTIGFVGEEIDEAAIETFCTGTTCTVQVWHDQSQSGGTGSGNDATQTTVNLQPYIYTGGQIVKKGGRAALDPQGFGGLVITGLTGTTTTNVFEMIFADQSPIISLDSANTQGKYPYLGWSGSSSSVGRGSNFYVNGVLESWSTRDDAWQALNDKQCTVSYEVDTSDYSDFELRYGVNNTAYAPIQQEVIIYFTVKNTSDRTDIQGNISDYYQSAKLLNEQYGEGAAAAYSVRQLNRDYTGAALQVERTSDNQTQDIGFDVDGNLDESALTTFCTGTVCKVRTWYDQSQTGGTGSGNDAVQTVHANQPTIYTGGAIVKIDGRAAVYFDRANNESYETTWSAGDTSAFTAFHTVKTVNTTTRTYLYDLRDSNDDGIRFFLQDDGTYFYSVNGSDLKTVDYTANKHLMFTNYRSSILAAAIDGNAENTLSGPATTSVTANAVLFRETAISDRNYFYGYAQEAIFYLSDKSTDRTDIEENVGDYFTQNTPLLDTYTGAAAAYSLRKLRSAYSGSAIRVRRASDNTEQDIGFNVFGELDTVSLASFCSGTDGFVKTWYDQSGSANDATQTTAASQPKIYDSSSGVVTDANGDATLDGDATTLTYMSLTSGVVMNTDWSVFMAGDFLNGDRTAGSGSYMFLVRTETSSTYARSDISSGIATSWLLGSTGSKVWSLNMDSSTGNFNLRVNGVDSNQTANTANYTITDLFYYGNPSLWTKGSIKEVILYQSSQYDNRTGIEDNINTFYDIY